MSGTITPVLILPGWQNSGPDHWQSRWEALHGYQRVDQHDWMQPRRGDWLVRLEDVLLSLARPAVLVAHSLGCILAAAWAAHTRNPWLVRGALLVAPGDVEQPGVADALPGWAPIERARLPFPSVLVASRNDPYCRFERAEALAQDWGSKLLDLGARGHLNAESGLGDWDEGHALIQPWLHATD